MTSATQLKIWVWFMLVFLFANSLMDVALFGGYSLPHLTWWTVSRSLFLNTLLMMWGAVLVGRIVEPPQ